MSDNSKAVFLSYASQDKEAAKRICDSLRAAGVEVWFDQNELVGGDQWDGKIRGQISSCALFVPVISANTQARREGYFRIEWRLAAQRTHAMSDDTPFLLPVVIDETRDVDAKVPPEFRAVQWTKLNNGESPVAFREQVKRLLGGELLAEASRRGSSASAVHGGSTAIGRSPRWVTPVLAVLVIAMIALLVARPWGKSATPSVSAKLIEPATAGAMTPAQQLVARARKILDQGDEMNRETYALAEELLLKAEALDVTEPSAWILHANVSASRIRYGLDRSAARHDALRAETDRAIQLAPDSLDAQLAESETFYLFEQDVPGVITRLQVLAAAHPDDWRVSQQLSQCYMVIGKLDEAVVANGRAMELSPDNPRLKSDRINLLVVAGRWAEADAAIAGLLRGRTGARLLAHEVYLKLMWRGDVSGAASAVRSWPAWFLLEDRGVAHAALVALWNRDSANALEVVQRFPRDYIRDYLFTGPSAVLSAWANEQAGNAESARADWGVVLQVTERELRAAPNDPFLLHWKAWALARLGDTQPAAGILQQLVEKNVSLMAMGQVVGRLGGLALMVGRTDLALALMTEKPSTLRRVITQTNLRLNPLFDPLRGDLRFQSAVDAAMGPGKVEKAAVEIAAIDTKSVAVLAFANLSDDKANEYFSDGISEELLNVLAKVPGLTVKGRSSGFFFKGKDTPVPEIAKQLGVTYVVQGSVRKAGNRVRISAQLIRAASDEVVWSSGSLDRDLQDIFAVQDEIAGLVAQQLQLKLGVTKPARVVDPEAHRLLLEARHYWHLRGEQNFDRTEALLHRALAIDPDFAPAHAAMADLWVMRAAYRTTEGADVSEELRLLRTSAARAMQLDPSLVAPIAAMAYGLLIEGRMPAAQQQFEAAVALSPNDPTVRFWQAIFLMQNGDFDAARREFTQARELDPKAWIITHLSGQNALELGRKDEALALLRQANADRPDGFAPAVGYESLALWQSGRTEEAVAAARAVRQSWPTQPRWQADAHAIWVLRQAGLTKEAAAYADALFAGLPAQTYQRGFVLAALGRFDEALPYLERTTTLALDPFASLVIFDPWRDDPRFTALIEKLHWTKPYARAREAMRQAAAEAKK